MAEESHEASAEDGASHTADGVEQRMFLVDIIRMLSFHPPFSLYELIIVCSCGS